MIGSRALSSSPTIRPRVREREGERELASDHEREGEREGGREGESDSRESEIEIVQLGNENTHVMYTGYNIEQKAKEGSKFVEHDSC